MSFFTLTNNSSCIVRSKLINGYFIQDTSVINGYLLHFVSFVLISGREAEKLSYVTKYLKAVAMFRDYNDVSQDPDFTQVSLGIIMKF